MKIKNAILALGLSTSIGLIAMPLSVGLLGCGKSQCDTLKDQCGACTGTAGTNGGQQACNSIVSAGNEDACKSAIDQKMYATDAVSCM